MPKVADLARVDQPRCHHEQEPGDHASGSQRAHGAANERITTSSTAALTEASGVRARAATLTPERLNEPLAG